MLCVSRPHAEPTNDSGVLDVVRFTNQDIRRTCAVSFAHPEFAGEKYSVFIKL